MNVVLDLDNTLIYSSSVNNLSKIQGKFFYTIYDDLVIIARPKLFEFLEWLFSNFNVSVFTYADKDYALFIIENFILRDKQRRKLNRKLDFIFYRYHVEMGRRLYNGRIKDLRLLWGAFDMFGFNSKNTVIIDDNEDVIRSNPNNSIYIKPFDSYDERDTELLQVKNILKNIQDV